MYKSVLYDEGEHRNLLIDNVAESGLAVQSNCHVIVHGGEALLLDPGGHSFFATAKQYISDLGAQPRYIFLSHQDPDCVAATNGWLLVSDAEAIIAQVWVRFLPHFGIDHLVEDRLTAIPDAGMWMTLGGGDLCILPAHFLHSCGNHQIYDPTSKILYSGDLGASLGMTYREVDDFDAHIQYMEGFHTRYMVSSKIIRAWVAMVRELDVETIAPQHGAMLCGRVLVDKFLDWCDGLSCGLDRLMDIYKVPPRITS